MWLGSLAFGFSAPAAETAPPTAVPPMLKTIEIEWEPVERVSGYEVRLMPKSGGKPLKFLTEESKFVRDIPVGEYSMQVRSRARDVDYMSPWSDPVPLEIVAKEITPLKPADNSSTEAIGIEKYTVEFEWKPVTGVKEYTLKVWNEHRVDRPWVFVTRNTKKKLDVPPGDVYHWQVLFESASAVSYAQSPTTFTFTVLGKKLTTPEIEKPKAEPEIKRLSWRESEGAEIYGAKLYYRHLDETKWKPVAALDTKETGWDVKRLKRGAYKLEVKATALRRTASDTASLEFVVKPKAVELQQAAMN